MAEDTSDASSEGRSPSFIPPFMVQANPETGKTDRKKCRAGKELVLGYWEKMGFVREREMSFKPGTLGSLTG